MEELNILEVPRILADTRYPVSDRIKLAGQFKDIVTKELGSLLEDISRFIDSKEHDKFSRIGFPEDAIDKLFIKPAYMFATLTKDDYSMLKDDIDEMVNGMTKALASLIKTKNILGV